MRKTGAEKLMLHIGETTIGVPFTQEQAQTLDAAFTQLLKTVGGWGFGGLTLTATASAII
jgi:hypothetical protein